MTHRTFFVDVNNTVTLQDRIQNKDLEVSILELVADLAPFGNGTYRSHISGDDTTEEQKQGFLRGMMDFFRRIGPNGQGCRDLPFLEAKMKEIRSAVDRQDGVVFRSFVKFLHTLKDTPHTVVLRSFGTDTTDVVRELEFLLDIKFTTFAQYREGKLYVDDKQVNEDELLAGGGIYQVWSDDYAYWKRHDFTWRGGKPFPAIPNAIFFDDKCQDKEIIAIFPVERKKMLSDGSLVAVSTLEALLNEDYFLQRAGL